MTNGPLITASCSTECALSSRPVSGHRRAASRPRGWYRMVLPATGTAVDGRRPGRLRPPAHRSRPRIPGTPARGRRGRTRADTPAWRATPAPRAAARPVGPRAPARAQGPTGGWMALPRAAPRPPAPARRRPLSLVRHLEPSVPASAPAPWLGAVVALVAVVSRCRRAKRARRRWAAVMRGSAVMDFAWGYGSLSGRRGCRRAGRRGRAARSSAFRRAGDWAWSLPPPTAASLPPPRRRT